MVGKTSYKTQETLDFKNPFNPQFHKAMGRFITEFTF